VGGFRQIEVEIERRHGENKSFKSTVFEPVPASERRMDRLLLIGFMA